MPDDDRNPSFHLYGDGLTKIGKLREFLGLRSRGIRAVDVVAGGDRPGRDALPEPLPDDRVLEICDDYGAVAGRVGKLFGVAVDACYSHKASHCGCDDAPTGPIYARFPGEGRETKPPQDQAELGDISGSTTACPSEVSKVDGQLTISFATQWDNCHLSVGGLVGAHTGEMFTYNGPAHPTTLDTYVIQASGAEPITVTMEGAGATTAPERPARGLYLGMVRGVTDQSPQPDPRHVVIYVHGVTIT